MRAVQANGVSLLALQSWWLLWRRFFFCLLCSLQSELALLEPEAPGAAHLAQRPSEQVASRCRRHTCCHCRCCCCHYRRLTWQRPLDSAPRTAQMLRCVGDGDGRAAGPAEDGSGAQLASDSPRLEQPRPSQVVSSVLSSEAAGLSFGAAATTAHVYVYVLR